MDYPVSTKSPDVAQAVVAHTIDAGGNAVPVGSANPSPAKYFPKPIVVSATAMTRPANTTAYSAGDAVSNNATAASVAPISFAASDLNNAPLLLTHLELLSADSGPAIAGATFEVWLFNADPTANSGVGGGDNAAFSQKQAGFHRTHAGHLHRGERRFDGGLHADRGELHSDYAFLGRHDHLCPVEDADGVHALGQRHDLHCHAEGDPGPCFNCCS